MKADTFDLESLAAELRPLPGVVVAYSGGVDSTVLLAAACEVLGRDRVLAVTADSPSLARAELRAAEAMAAALDVELQLLGTEELEDPRYRENLGDRCYWCKEQLFTHAAQVAEARGWVLAYGENADDDADDRPGARSAAEREVRAPLRAAGWDKRNVRAFARDRRLAVAEKPAAPCLASRVATGVPVDLETLERIEGLEAAIKRRGYAVVRARHLDDRRSALEFDATELGRARSETDRLVALAAEFGYPECSLRAYRSGSVAL